MIINPSLRLAAVTSLLTCIVCSSTAQAVSTIPGFTSDIIRISSGNGATDTQINTTTEGQAILDAAIGLTTGSTGVITSGSTTYNVVQVARDIGVGEINYGGGPGNFGGNNPFPDGLVDSDTDYIVTAEAYVVIPAGTWQIAIGSDDGGFLTLPGVTLTNEINEVGGVSGDDTLFFNSPRGHSSTIGTFTLTSELTTTLSALIFERAGAESFEISIRDASAGSVSSVNSTDFALLQDGQFGFSVTQAIPEPSTSFLLLLTIPVMLRRKRRSHN